MKIVLKWNLTVCQLLFWVSGIALEPLEFETKGNKSVCALVSREGKDSRKRRCRRSRTNAMNGKSKILISPTVVADFSFCRVG